MVYDVWFMEASKLLNFDLIYFQIYYLISDLRKIYQWV